MGFINLEKFFTPESIAVIGASERPGRIGTALINNLLDGGFSGRILPVNPKYKRIRTLSCVPSVAALDTGADLAVVAVPIRQVSGILGQCADIGIQAAIIISAGGRETGAPGLAIEQDIAAVASAHGIRVIGPNCLGIMAPGRKLNASFAAGMPNAGNIGFVSQSGGICTAVLDLSFKEGIGFSHFVSVGSMLDVDFADIIDYLGKDPSTRSILLYIEQLTNIRTFISAARAVSRVKPILALKAGTSPAGSQAAASHTGALAAEDCAYDAAFKRAGITRVHNLEELFDIAELLAKQPRPSGSRMAVITNSGGPGVLAIDAMHRCGVTPATLSPRAIAELAEILPSHWNRRNPVDIYGDASPERYAQAIRIVVEHDQPPGLLVILSPQALNGPMEVARALVSLLADRHFPVFAVWMGGRDVESAVQFMNNSGIATYNTPERAVLAFSYMVQHIRNLEMSRHLPPRLEQRLFFNQEQARAVVRSADLSGSLFLNENQAGEILSAYGLTVLPSVPADSAEAASAAAQQVGWPVVMKILSIDIPHKTDADGVQLDLRSPAEAVAAWNRIMAGAYRYNANARITGVTVQPCIADPDYELLMGVKRDEVFGPLILFGAGGVLTEFIGDRAIGLAPLNRSLATQLIEETRVFRLLQGYRNKPLADVNALVTMLLRLSQLVVDIPEIDELDLNPVIVKNGRPTIVDSRILLRRCSRPAPLHLAISPYPSQYEICTTTKGGLRIQIRPIRPEDAELFVELFKNLSPSSVYFRFFQHIKELSPDMLAMLTQIDYDRHMALIALDLSADREKMLGVARIIADPEISQCEFSIMVGDQWHGQGVGAQLLLHLLKVAKQQGVEKIWGLVLPENTQMLRLAKKFGFGVRFDREEGAYRLHINLAEARLE